MIRLYAENRYKIALGVLTILVVSMVIFVTVYRDSTELRGDIRYKKINTTEEEYKQMEKSMENYVLTKLTVDSTGMPDVAVAPTMISDDTYTHFSTDKDKIKIEVTPDKKGSTVEQLKLEGLIYLEDSILGVYINEKGTLRAVKAELNKEGIDVYTSDRETCIGGNSVALIPLMNSEAKLDRDLRKIVELALIEDSENRLMDKYFNRDSRNEFKSVMEQIKKPLVGNEYSITVKFGKSSINGTGKDRVYLRLCNIGADNGVVDMILKLDSNNQIFDMDVL